MKVAELIEELKKQNQDAEVVVPDCDHFRYYTFGSIKATKIVKKSREEYCEGFHHPQSTLIDAVMIG